MNAFSNGKLSHTTHFGVNKYDYYKIAQIKSREVLSITECTEHMSAQSIMFSGAIEMYGSQIY